MKSTLFINQFQKGTGENANIGIGTLVGVETYTKKSVAGLTKKSTKAGGDTVTGLVKYIIKSLTGGNSYLAIDEAGKVYFSNNSGTTWTNTFSLAATARGLVSFQGYYFAFVGGEIKYSSTNNGSVWSAAWQTGVSTEENVPFLYPSGNKIFFSNGSKVGYFGLSPTGTFNPAGANGTDYIYNATGLTLPSTYLVTALSFLPPGNLAIGTSPNISGTVTSISMGDKQIADIFTWDTTSNAVVSPPLRLYSQSINSEGGIRQLVTRNNVLYAVTGGNHSIFETNGSNFKLIASLGLRSNIRTTGGTESTLPVIIRQNPMAIDIMGNKLLTGVSTPSDISYYTTGYGLFPIGAWSIAFGEDDTAIQCEYSLSTGTIVAVNKQVQIGAIKVINYDITTGSGGVLISWQDDTAYGIDYVEFSKFQTDSSVVLMESPMFEIGTPLNPGTINNIQLNLVRKLLTNQTISVYSRKTFDEDFTLQQTFTGDGTENQYKITSNTIGSTQYVQLQIRMATPVASITSTPQLRTVIIS